MEYLFPPPPPGYTRVLLARLVLCAWAVIGAGIIRYRLRHWKFVWSREMAFWGIAAVVSGGVAVIGFCQYTVYDTNIWLTPAASGAVAVCAAGMTVALFKLYVDGSETEKRPVFAFVTLVILIACSAQFLLLILVQPSVGGGRPAPSSFCRTSGMSIGIGLLNYHDSYGSFPSEIDGRVPVSWRVSVLPFIDQALTYRDYNRNAPWDQPPNAAIASHMFKIFVCPSNYYPRDALGRWYTAFSMPTGPHTVGDRSQGTKLSEITDGLGQTLLLVEACGARIVWTEPRDINVANNLAGINMKGSKPRASDGWMSSYHENGVNVVFADGSAKLLSSKIDPAVLKKLATVNDGDVPQESIW